MNIWSCLWATIGILVTGEIYGLVNFVKLYPYVIYNIFLLGLTGAIGQVRKMMIIIIIEERDFCFLEFYFSYY
jgi:hypothetical protein